MISLNIKFNHYTRVLDFYFTNSEETEPSLNEQQAMEMCAEMLVPQINSYLGTFFDERMRRAIENEAISILRQVELETMVKINLLSHREIKTFDYQVINIY